MIKQGDLHLHTYHSDGTNSKEELVLLAKEKEFEFIAVTDHDHIPDEEENMSLSNKYGIEIINGVEVSTVNKATKRRVHILCYFPQDLTPVKEICDDTTNNRIYAGKKMAEKVSEKIGISVDEINDIAKNSDCIYKQHIMQVLINHGYTDKIYGQLWKELFDLKNGTCLISCKQPDTYDTIYRLKNAGGILVMAHPYTYDSIDLLKDMLDKNLLDGVEVWSSKSNREQEQYLSDLCDNYKVIKTGGSDFHGSNSPTGCTFGVAYTPNDSIEQLYKLKEKIRW